MTRSEILCTVDSRQMFKSCTPLPCNLTQSRSPASIIGKSLRVTPVVRLIVAVLTAVVVSVSVNRWHTETIVC